MFAGSMAVPISIHFVAPLSCTRGQATTIDEASLRDLPVVKTGDVLETENGGSLKRNDSEFSLGLTRSESFDNIVSTLGPLCIFPLCDTGEALWGAGEYAAKIVLAALVAKTIYEATNSMAPNLLKRK